MDQTQSTRDKLTASHTDRWTNKQGDYYRDSTSFVEHGLHAANMLGMFKCLLWKKAILKPQPMKMNDFSSTRYLQDNNQLWQNCYRVWNRYFPDGRLGDRMISQNLVCWGQAKIPILKNQVVENTGSIWQSLHLQGKKKKLLRFIENSANQQISNEYFTI